jgi:hypothetical protein
VPCLAGHGDAPRLHPNFKIIPLIHIGHILKTKLEGRPTSKVILSGFTHASCGGHSVSVSMAASPILSM